MAFAERECFAVGVFNKGMNENSIAQSVAAAECKTLPKALKVASAAAIFCKTPVKSKSKYRSGRGGKREYAAAALQQSECEAKGLT